MSAVRGPGRLPHHAPFVRFWAASTVSDFGTYVALPAEDRPTVDYVPGAELGQGLLHLLKFQSFSNKLLPSKNKHTDPDEERSKDKSNRRTGQADQTEKAAGDEHHPGCSGVGAWRKPSLFISELNLALSIRVGSTIFLASKVFNPRPLGWSEAVDRSGITRGLRLYLFLACWTLGFSWCFFRNISVWHIIGGCLRNEFGQRWHRSEPVVFQISGAGTLDRKFDGQS